MVNSTKKSNNIQRLYGTVYTATAFTFNGKEWINIATICKRDNDSYEIKVSCGYGVEGK